MIIVFEEKTYCSFQQSCFLEPEVNDDYFLQCRGSASGNVLSGQTEIAPPLRLTAGPGCLLSTWGSGGAVGPHHNLHHPWDHHIWILLRVKASAA